MRRPSVAIMQNGERSPPSIAALAASCAPHLGANQCLPAGAEADAAAAGPLAAAAAAAAAVSQHQAMLVQQQQRRAVAPGTQAAAGTGRDAEDTAACQEALQGQRKAAHVSGNA